MSTDSGGHAYGRECPAEPGRTENRFGGTVHGPAIQARDIHGGFHVHGAADTVPTPRQLPAAGPLVGREAELGELDAVRAAGTRMAVVSGPAGIGKTALVLRWAHRIRPDYPDGQLFADLHGHKPGDPLSSTRVLGGLLRALGTRPDRLPADLAEAAALFRSLTAERRILVVIDDAMSAAQVRPLLPASETSLAVVTSRWRLTGLLARGARGVQLDRLDEEAAMLLLGLAVGAERTSAEPESARRVVRLCARHPLALCVAAARLAARPRWPLREMVDALSQERGRLSVLSTGEEDDMAVRGAIDVSYRALPVDVARMYRLLGLFPGTSFESGMAAALADLSSAEARRLLNVLADANLLSDTTAGRYRFHDLIRLHAAEMADRDEAAAEREAAVGRMLAWYLATARAARQAAAPYRRPQGEEVPQPAEPREFTSGEEALDWMDRELAEMMAVARLAYRDGLFTPAWRLISTAWPLFLRRGRYAERLEFDTLGLEAAIAAGDPEGKARMRDRVGHALRDLGRTEEAAEHFTEALTQWRELARTDRVIDSLRRLAIIAGDRDRATEAIAHLHEALGLCRATPSTHPRALALAHSDLGAALTRAGRSDEAIDHLDEARRILPGIPDAYNQARVLIRLGRAHLASGSPEAAEPLLTEALGTMREIASPPGEAEAQEALGDLARSSDQTEEAGRRYQEALDVLDRIGSPKADALRHRLTLPRQGRDSPKGPG